MEAGKLKNIVIVILVCVNLAFGGIVLAERRDSAEGEAQSRSELAAVLAGLGIQLEAEQFPMDVEVLRYSVSRSVETENAVVSALLGEAECEDQGGNIRSYVNDSGWARFRSGGSFEVSMAASGSSLESRLRDSGVAVSREGDSYVCTMGDAKIFNCRFALSQRDGGIYISGRFLPGTPVAEAAPEHTDAATLLLRFHDEMRSGGGVYTRITEILPGYMLNVTASSMELAPVWRITTDGGVHYLDVGEARLLTVVG